MEYRKLGRTGLKVSELCLGTMQFGWTADEATSFAVMDAFVEAGGNFIDTADVYSRWAEGNPGGVSEQIIGRWLKARGNRGAIVLATKARGRMWDGPNGEGLSRMHLIRACEDSLRRLDTDTIDLYQTHFYDADTPIDETLRALDDLVRSGKVRYVGCSNYPAWRLTKALWASDKLGLARYDSLQPHYSLAYRAEFERELKPLCEEEGIGVIPYSPLAGGFLTGKYRRDSIPPSARAEGIQQRYFNDRGFAIVEKLAGNRQGAQSEHRPDCAGLAVDAARHHRADRRRELGRAIGREPGRGRGPAEQRRDGRAEYCQRLGIRDHARVDRVVCSSYNSDQTVRQEGAMSVLVRLSSKGQLVIPGSVRRALKLSPGDEFRLEITDRMIILNPVEATSPIDALFGRFAGSDLLGDLEQEHRREIENEQAIRP